MNSCALYISKLLKKVDFKMFLHKNLVSMNLTGSFYIINTYQSLINTYNYYLLTLNLKM
jgi:hypothetical protein